MSTPRKRTADEAERVRLVNRLACLWLARAVADDLLAGRPQQARFAAWLQQYTAVYLADSVKRQGRSEISQKALLSYITYLSAGKRRRADDRPTQLMQAILQTREVVAQRRQAKVVCDPFAGLQADKVQVVKARYARVAARLIARTYQPIAGWDRLAWLYRDATWPSRIEWDKTLDELAREDAARLDKVP